MLRGLSKFSFAASLSLGAVALAGCATESDPTRPDRNAASERGALGKADLVGSCADDGELLCGGKSNGTCWCDELCVDFGDCCSDAGEVCGVGPQPQICGGFAGLPCPDGMVCVDDPDDACDLENGGADCSGICVEEEPPLFCGGFAGLPCPGGMVCVDDPSDDCDPENGGADCGGICVEEEPAPFCGGIANIPCPEGLLCIDDPNDGCDPENGGADCGGICVTDPNACPPVLCELFCPFGFAEGDDGCPICSCAEQPEQSECTDAGGICEVGFITGCDEGFEPAAELDCGAPFIETVCCAPIEEPEPAGDSCEGLCGSKAETCWCDDLCSFYGDCCDDVGQWCS